ncbi:MAG: hypothetical protein IJE21_06690 [Alistipes sp.]|nr:hypothetical protein [Alistipes sp.]
MNERRSIVLPLVITVVSMLLAMFLLCSALVVWLAEFFGSLTLPCLLVGLFMAAIAVTVYLVSLRDAAERLNDWTHTIYDVSRLVQDGYDWAIGLLKSVTRGGGVG